MNLNTLNNYPVVFWDFDGVILESNVIRTKGFRELFSDFDEQFIEELISYHVDNGGLSRYHKIRFFFEEILESEISDDEVNHWANKYSELVKEKLINDRLLISETNSHIRNNYSSNIYHIVSGSDQEELRDICKQLNIDKYFESINGSPTAKNELVRRLIKANNYSITDCILIGDSVNDKEAAEVNNIRFFPFNFIY